MSLPYRVQIIGLGRYLPRTRVDNATVEARFGLRAGTIARTAAGVVSRRWAERDETNSFMAAEAAREALADAGLAATDLDLIVNASGSQEQAVPDGGPLVQRALGLGDSGIPAFTLHTTCLSFLSALDVVGALVQAGRYRRVLVTTSELPSTSLNPDDIESACLFGDAATAAVIVPAPADASSAITHVRFETYGDGADFTCVRGGGTRRHPNDPETQPEDNLFHHPPNHSIKHLHQPHRRFHLLLMPRIIACPIFEERKIIVHCQRDQPSSRFARIHHRRVGEAEHRPPAFAGEIG